MKTHSNFCWNLIRNYRDVRCERTDSRSHLELHTQYTHMWEVSEPTIFRHFCNIAEYQIPKTLLENSVLELWIRNHCGDSLCAFMLDCQASEYHGISSLRVFLVSRDSWAIIGLDTYWATEELRFSSRLSQEIFLYPRQTQPHTEWVTGCPLRGG